MKDLYTFDHNKSLALETYEQVRTVYGALFDELKIPYLVAEADSGDMGGNLSHEFQFCTSKGEDHVVNCQSCGYVANEEMAQTAIPPEEDSQDWLNWTFMTPEKLRESAVSSPQRAISVWRGLSLDKSVLINVWYPLGSPSSTANIPTYTQPGINTHAVKAILPELDPGVENAGLLWNQKQEYNGAAREDGTQITGAIINLIDCRVPAIVRDAIASGDPKLPFLPDSVNKMALKVMSPILSRHPRTREPINLLRIRDGDKCPRCHDGTLKVQLAVELGHTFYLGDRYSGPLEAIVTVPAEAQAGSTQRASQQVPMQMGCHGIGVSRMVGAVAEILADAKGLNWPRVIAPYEAVVVPAQGNELDAEIVYDLLVASSGNSSDTKYETLDLVLDDRAYPFPWKMRDADLVGYPVIVVVGRAWKNERICEVQCRRLGVRENVASKGLYGFVRKLLEQL
jgi:prolyl-tRNA synthetase